MGEDVNQRKLEHIRVLQAEPETDRRKYYFDDIRLTHRALPEVNLADIDTSLTFLGKPLSFPLLISSMTGGDHEVVRKVNRNLAAAAEATGVAMGVGSQRVMFTDASARKSFELRETAPTTVLIANLGAVQLNCGFTPAQCREAVDVLAADGMYLHLNPLQEAAQIDGDTCFSGLAERIAAAVQALDCPVLLKEVGAGISPEDVTLALDAGVRHIDVAGAGGTSWSRIEYHRHAEDAPCSVGKLFQDWGIPTPEALRRLWPFSDRITVIASGGVRNGIDMVKAMILGASLCGIARPFLAPAMESADAVIEAIEAYRSQFRVAMFLLGIDNIEALKNNRNLIVT